MEEDGHNPIWTQIPNLSGWEYDAAAERKHTYSDSPGTITGGVRQYTTSSGNVCETYIRCRQIEHPTRILGEVSKTYYDKQ